MCQDAIGIPIFGPQSGISEAIIYSIMMLFVKLNNRSRSDENEEIVGISVKNVTIFLGIFCIFELPEPNDHHC